MSTKRKSAAGGRTLDRLVRRWQSQAGYWRAGSAFLRSEGHMASSERELGRCEALLQCARELRQANKEMDQSDPSGIYEIDGEDWQIQAGTAVRV